MNGAIARRAALGGGAFVAVGLATVFLLTPIVALVTYQPIGSLLSGVTSPVATDAMLVSLKTNLIAFGIELVIGTPCAYILARTRFPGREIVLTLVEVPLVLPPAVAGIALLVAFGRLGLLGGVLAGLGIELAFSQAAVVLAILFVAAPFYLRGAIAAFAGVDEGIIDVAATLGAGPLRRLLAIAVPAAGAGLGGASAVAFARGMGEFGATILFAGSFQGTTQTLPLAVYSLFDANLDQAVAIGVLLVAVSAAILITIKLFAAHLISRSWSSTPQTSRSRAGASRSPSR